ncbi:MAG: hypothetical protein PVSMB4_06500 [Ktedonobacterales bacterium]
MRPFGSSARSISLVAIHRLNPLVPDGNGSTPPRPAQMAPRGEAWWRGAAWRVPDVVVGLQRSRHTRPTLPHTRSANFVIGLSDDGPLCVFDADGTFLASKALKAWRR